MITITQEKKTELILLLASADYDVNRIDIADHEIQDDVFTLWLEDKRDFKNILEECLKIEMPLEQFAKFIKVNELNAYEGTKQREGGSVYKCMIEVAEPIDYYQQDATAYQQRFIREELIKSIFKQVVNEN